MQYKHHTQSFVKIASQVLNDLDSRVDCAEIERDSMHAVLTIVPLMHNWLDASDHKLRTAKRESADWLSEFEQL